MRGPLQGPSRGPRPPRSAPAVSVQTPSGRTPETPLLIHPESRVPATAGPGGTRGSRGPASTRRGPARQTFGPLHWLEVNS